MAFKPILPHSLSDHHLAEMSPEATPGLPCAHTRPSRHTVKQKEVMETTLHCSSQRIWERKLVLNDSYLKLWTMGKNYFLCYVGMRLILFVLVFEELRWKVVCECKILPLLSWKGEAYTPNPLYLILHLNWCNFTGTVLGSLKVSTAETDNSLSTLCSYSMSALGPHKIDQMLIRIWNSPFFLREYWQYEVNKIPYTYKQICNLQKFVTVQNRHLTFALNSNHALGWSNIFHNTLLTWFPCQNMPWDPS